MIDYKKLLLNIYLLYFSYYKENIANGIIDFDSKTRYKNGIIDEINEINRDNENLNENIKSSINFYLNQVEYADWGCLRLYEIVGNDDLYLYLIRVTTDGDDGWIELYEKNGNRCVSGRNYLELISFEDDIDKLHNYVNDSSFPESMDVTKTKWNQPLPWTLD